MTRRYVFAAIIALIFFLIFILIKEKHFLIRNLIFASPITILLSLGIVTQLHERKNPALLFSLTILTLFFLYFLIKNHRTLDTYIFTLMGVSIGLMIYYGWILPHKPFSRKDYIKEQQEKKYNS